MLEVLADQARETLPALMHEVQAFTFLVLPPPAATRTDWMLGFQRRRVAFLDHGRLLPKPGFLSQMSQTLATGSLPKSFLIGRDERNPDRVPDRPAHRPIGPHRRFTAVNYSGAAK